MRFSKILGGFQKVFAWLYKDIRGFDPGLTRHAIVIKEGMKPARKKQGPINSTFKATFQRELENFLRAGIIFSVHHEWVSNWVPVSKTTDHIRTYINFCTFIQVVMRNPFPPLNMEIILQQDVESQLRSLLDSFLVCRKIKEKGVDAYKTTPISDWGTMTYKCFFFFLTRCKYCF
jgi:hypothetical protein